MTWAPSRSEIARVALQSLPDEPRGHPLRKFVESQADYTPVIPVEYADRMGYVFDMVERYGGSAFVVSIPPSAHADDPRPVIVVALRPAPEARGDEPVVTPEQAPVGRTATFGMFVETLARTGLTRVSYNKGEPDLAAERIDNRGSAEPVC